MTGRILAATCLAAGAIILGSACGGNDAAPSPTPGGGGGGGATTGTTITITAGVGVSPKTLTVARGTQVTFVNSDSVPHEMASNPHPTHGSCPEIDQIGFLSPGQTKVSGNLNTATTCGYHDHNRNTDTSLQGTIVVQ